MNIPFRTAALAAALVVAIAPALAHDYSSSSNSRSSMGTGQERGFDSAFNRADTNGDGQLSRSEFEAMRQQLEARNAAPLYRHGAMMLSPSWNKLSTKRVEEVEGMDVINRSGAKIGDVDRIVRNPRDNRVYAVVSVGGFLGVGDTDITLPLDQMALQGNRLVAPTTASNQQIRHRGEHEAISYRKLDDDQIIGQAQSMAGMEGGYLSPFGDLDTNHDGQISKREAHADRALMQAWDYVDANRDGVIDRAEFSAFENGERPAPGGWPGRTRSEIDSQEGDY